MKCVVCHQADIDQSQNGRSTARTCGTICSGIRNTVGSDDLAREKWLAQHAADAAMKAFTAPQRIRK